MQWGDCLFLSEMAGEGFKRHLPFEPGFDGQVGVHHGVKGARWEGHLGLGKGMKVRMNNVFCLVNTSC